MKRLHAVLGLPAIGTLLAMSLAACIDLGGDWFPQNQNADASADAGHECEEHGGVCEYSSYVQIGPLDCDTGRIRADYACGSAAPAKATCCVPRPPCESILVGLGNAAPRCVARDDCAADDQRPRGDCAIGICCSPTPPFTPPAPVHDAGTSG